MQVNKKIIKYNNIYILNKQIKIGDVAQLVEHYDTLRKGLGFNSSHLHLIIFN